MQVAAAPVRRGGLAGRPGEQELDLAAHDCAPRPAAAARGVCEESLDEPRRRRRRAARVAGRRTAAARNSHRPRHVAGVAEVDALQHGVDERAELATAGGALAERRQVQAAITAAVGGSSSSASAAGCDATGASAPVICENENRRRAAASTGIGSDSRGQGAGAARRPARASWRRAAARSAPRGGVGRVRRRPAAAR